MCLEGHPLVGPPSQQVWKKEEEMAFWVFWKIRREKLPEYSYYTLMSWFEKVNGKTKPLNWNMINWVIALWPALKNTAHSGCAEACDMSVNGMILKILGPYCRFWKIQPIVVVNKHVICHSVGWFWRSLGAMAGSEKHSWLWISMWYVILKILGEPHYPCFLTQN